MRVLFDAPKGRRIRKGSLKVGNRRVNNFDSLECCGLWWYEDKQKWIDLGDWKNEGNVSSNNRNIKNLKQAIRHIKKHNYLSKGQQFRLVGNFQGYDIIIIL